ncbi:MAG: cytochrome c [Pirellulaceae bacterium]
MRIVVVALILNSLLLIQSSNTFAQDETFVDIASIIHNKCTICHRDGGPGPFALSTFDEVAERAATIEAVLDQGYMPPWKPVDHGLSFANDRSLSPDEKKSLLGWIQNGLHEGDKAAIPKSPTFPSDWMLGPPDMTIEMKGEFVVPADGPDIYRSFVFPLGLAEDKWVKAIELRPSAPGAVHHALFFLDTTGGAREMDGQDGRPGLSGMGFFRIRDVGSDKTPKPGDGAGKFDQALARGLGGYVPGAMPSQLPGDLAMHLPAGGTTLSCKRTFIPPEKSNANIRRSHCILQISPHRNCLSPFRCRRFLDLHPASMFLPMNRIMYWKIPSSCRSPLARSALAVTLTTFVHP